MPDDSRSRLIENLLKPVFLGLFGDAGPAESNYTSALQHSVHDLLAELQTLTEESPPGQAE